MWARRRILLHLEGHAAPLAFDDLYPALGTSARIYLACQLGLNVNEFGNVADTTPFAA
jgi:thioredoxin reductase (NADPH)